MSDTPALMITFVRKASLEDSVEFSFSAVVADPESDKGVLSPEELLTSVCLSIYKAGQAVCLDRLQQLVSEKSQPLEDQG